MFRFSYTDEAKSPIQTCASQIEINGTANDMFGELWCLNNLKFNIKETDCLRNHLQTKLKKCHRKLKYKEVGMLQQLLLILAVLQLGRPQTREPGKRISVGLAWYEVKVSGWLTFATCALLNESC